MRKYSLLYTAFGLIAILGTLHFVAEAFYFYWTIWWFDSLMHLLAGFSGGLVVLWFSGPFGIFRSNLLALVCVLAVGISWEVFEYVYNIAEVTNYWRETIFDLVADGLGAMLACFYASVQTPKSS